MGLCDSHKSIRLYKRFGQTRSFSPRCADVGPSEGSEEGPGTALGETFCSSWNFMESVDIWRYEKISDGSWLYRHMGCGSFCNLL